MLGGDADPNKLNKWDIQYHVMYLSCGAAQGRVMTAEERAGHQVVRKLYCVSFTFVYSFPQYYFCYFLLPLLFCSTVFIPTHKFCLFHPILPPIPSGWGRAVWFLVPC